MTRINHIIALKISGSVIVIIVPLSPFTLTIWSAVPQITALFMFLLEAGLLLLAYLVHSKGSIIEDDLRKRTQQVIDQESAKLPNSKKYRWKMITVRILKSRYKVEDASNEI